MIKGLVRKTVTAATVAVVAVVTLKATEVAESVLKPKKRNE